MYWAWAAAEDTPISILSRNTLGHLHEHRNGRQMNDAGAAMSLLALFSPQSAPLWVASQVTSGELAESL
jgi:hypothetical protein